MVRCINVNLYRAIKLNETENVKCNYFKFDNHDLINVDTLDVGEQIDLPEVKTAVADDGKDMN